jgi:hypothetical protein
MDLKNYVISGDFELSLFKVSEVIYAAWIWVNNDQSQDPEIFHLIKAC